MSHFHRLTTTPLSQSVPAALWFVLFLFVCTRAYIPLIQPQKKKNHFAFIAQRKSSAPLCASPSSSFLPSCLFLPFKFWLRLITRRPLVLPCISVFMIADPYWSTSKHCTRPLSPTVHISVCVCVCRFQFTWNRFVQIWKLRDELVW